MALKTFEKLYGLWHEVASDNEADRDQYFQHLVNQVADFIKTASPGNRELYFQNLKAVLKKNNIATV